MPELVLGKMTPDGRAEWLEPVRQFSAKQQRQMHVLPTSAATDDLSQMLGGRNKRPARPIALVDAGGNQLFILGLGGTEVAEMEDIVAEQREKQPMNQDELRARFGMPSSKEAGPMMAEAIAERRRKHMRNPRTDPARQPAPPPAEWRT